MPAVTSSRKSQSRNAKNRQLSQGAERQLIWIMTAWDEVPEFRFLQYSGGIPRIYERDKYPYADITKAPYFDDFGDIAHHFLKQGGVGPVQIAVELLPEFSFGPRTIKQAMKLAA